MKLFPPVFLFTVLLSVPLLSQIKGGGKISPYYSYYSFYLAQKESTVFGDPWEPKLYFNQILQSFHPRQVLIEGAFYPLPYACSAVRETSSYDNFQLGENFHLLKSLAAGYDEPWALSLLLGNLWGFKHPAVKDKWQGAAYMGFILSCGNKQLFANQMITDDWWQLEWKVKGIRYTFRDKKEWNFYFGFKKHSEENVADIFYVNFYRNHTLYVKSKKRAFLPNFSVNWRTELDLYKGGLVSQYLLLGKKFPWKKRIFIFEFGILWQEQAKFRGFSEEEQNFQIILRPNIEF